MSTATFIAMERQRALWGIHAQIVRAIVAAGDWEGDEPFDIAEALGLAAPRHDAARPILLVGPAENASPIRALGPVALRQVEVSSVLPVPQLARHPDQRQTVSGLSFVEGGMPLLVLDPIALLALAGEHRRP